MNIEEFLAEQREKIKQDRNRILSSTFTKEVPEFFPDIDLEEPISISGKVSLGNGSAQEDENQNIDEQTFGVPLSKEFKNAANEIQLLQIDTHDNSQGNEKGSPSIGISTARNSKVSDYFD